MVEQMFQLDASVEMILLAIRAAEINGVSRNVTQNVPRDGLSMTPGAIRSRRHRRNNNETGQNAEANDAAQQPVPERSAERSAVTDHCELSSLSVSKEATKTGSKKEGVARGTRLSSEVLLSDADRKFAIDNGVSNPDALWAEFVDFWIGIPGQRGTKLNWSATWRNRVRAVSTKHGKSNVRQTGSPILDNLAANRAGIAALGLRLRASPDHARLLPEGRGQRSEDIFERGGGAVVPIQPVGDLRGDKPADGHAEQNGLHADAEGTEVRLRTGGAAGKSN